MPTITTDKDVKLDLMVRVGKALSAKWAEQIEGGGLDYSIEVRGSRAELVFTQSIWNEKRHTIVREVCELYVLDYYVVPLGNKLVVTIT